MTGIGGWDGGGAVAVAVEGRGGGGVGPGPVAGAGALAGAGAGAGARIVPSRLRRSLAALAPVLEGVPLALALAAGAVLAADADA